MKRFWIYWCSALVASCALVAIYDLFTKNLSQFLAMLSYLGINVALIIFWKKQA